MATKRTYQPSKTRRARRMVSCAAAPAAAKCCATGALAAGAGSGCSRGRQALRAGCGAPAEQKADFERLLRHGARRNLDGYTMYVGRRDSGAARLGVLISRRHAARRRAQSHQALHPEAFRLEQERLGPIDVLVRPPYAVKPSAQMVVRLREIFGRLA